MSNERILNRKEINELNTSIVHGSSVALTTFDNPYDPFTQFNDWFLFDTFKGYNSCSYLARIAHTSEGLSKQENDEELERAIDEIIKFDPFNIYRKVINNSLKTNE